MAQLIRKTPEELANAFIKPESELNIRRTTAPYNDEIKIKRIVNERNKPTVVTQNHPPIGSYKGYKTKRLDLPTNWQRYKDPFNQAKGLVSEADIKNKAIERWKSIPEEKRNEIGIAYGRALDPFDFDEESASEYPASLEEDIDYFNSEYFTPDDWETLDEVLKQYGY